MERVESAFQLKKGDGQERKILHICLFSWQNKGTPAKPTEMLYLVSDINYNRKLFAEEAEKSGWLKGSQYDFSLLRNLLILSEEAGCRVVQIVPVYCR